MSMQERIKENEAYLASHPEVKELVSSFLLEILKDKPENVAEYATKYFSGSSSNKRASVSASSSAVAPPPPGKTGGGHSDSKPENTSFPPQGNGNGHGHAPLVIVGPSGVGKGTLITRLMKEFSEHFGFSVSHTTRRPRDAEQHGVHYHFTTHDEMRDGVRQGLFIEHAEVHDNIYGTSYSAVGNVRAAGKICLLDIDVQGMQAMKRTHLAPKTIFIAPPSHEELEKRLRGRGTESEEAIQRRLANSRREMEELSKPGMVHHTIVNDDLDTAYEALKKQLLDWYPHLHSE